MTADATAKPGALSPPKHPRYSLVVPVYNEAENIASFCKALADLPAGHEVLICHDFEGDDTLAELDRLPREEKPASLRFVLNTLGPGVRYAIEAGMREAAAPVVVVTMADISDDFSRVEAMVAGVEAGADVVCASRYMPGGRQIGGPRIKAMLSRLAGLTLHRLSGLPTRDPTNSFKAYSREFLRRTRIESPAGFALAMELTVKAHFGGGRVEEVPATWRGRTKGTSRFRLLSWLPLYLRWYFWALRRRWIGSEQERRVSRDRPGHP
jgi:dolichol-phosphate mannosyltransferase